MFVTDSSLIVLWFLRCCGFELVVFGIAGDVGRWFEVFVWVVICDFLRVCKVNLFTVLPVSLLLV